MPSTLGFFPQLKPPTPTDVTFYSTNSVITPAALVDMANNVQQRKLDLIQTVNYAKINNHKQGKHQSKQSRCKPKNQSQTPAPPCFYCWLHIGCTHTSSICCNKFTGHKDAAALSDMLGGSTNNCFWLPS